MTRRLLALAVVLALAPAPAPAAAQGADEEPDVTALGAVVYDPGADRVLWGRREDVGIPMASTTKIMTTLLALEAGVLGDTLTVSRRAAQMGGAGLGLRMGQQLPVRSVLAGLMLRSGNDAATAIAEHVAGSEAAFVARMNARALELGLQDTHFVNASGLTDDRRHRASPLDLARLTDVAMAHPEFAQWAGARRLTVPGLPPMDNRNELIGRYAGATGVKTGYLAHAGFALVASATREDLALTVVVLGSQDSFADAIELFDWAFARYRLARPAGPGAPVTRYHWADGETGLLAGDGVAAAVRRDAVVRWRLRLAPLAGRPVAAGQSLGEGELVENGAVVAATPLFATHDVPAPPSDRPSASPAAAASGAGSVLEEALRAFARLEPAEAAA